MNIRIIASALVVMLPVTPLFAQSRDKDAAQSEFAALRRRYAIRERVDTMLSMAAHVGDDRLAESAEFAVDHSILGIPELHGIRAASRSGDAKKTEDIYIVPVLPEDRSTMNSWSPPGHPDSLYYDPDKHALFVPEKSRFSDPWLFIAFATELRRAWIDHDKPYDRHSVPVSEAVASEDLDVLKMQAVLVARHGGPRYEKAFVSAVADMQKQAVRKGDLSFPGKSSVTWLNALLGEPKSPSEWSYRQEVVYKAVGIGVMEAYFAPKEPDRTRQGVRYMIAYRNHLRAEKAKQRDRMMRTMTK